MGKIKAFIYRKDESRCKHCGKKLDETEKTYYENSCEKCEQKIFKKYHLDM